VTHPDNAASQSVATRLGMRAVGLTDDYYGTTCALFVSERAS
jgi:RimJ/RimL family protein N-acetyltransferase